MASNAENVSIWWRHHNWIGDNERVCIRCCLSSPLLFFAIFEVVFYQFTDFCYHDWENILLHAISILNWKAGTAIVKVRSWNGGTHCMVHGDVIKWRHFPRYWPFVRWIHRSPVNSPHKGQRRGALMFSLICTWIMGLVNNRKTGDLRRRRAYYDVTLMYVYFP